MAQLIGHQLVVVGDTTVVHTVQSNPLGSRAFDANGNEYIYLKGVASTVAGSAATFNTSFQTALTVTGAKGPVGIACAATVANTYGWYQIFGSGSGDFAPDRPPPSTRRFRPR